MSPGNYSYGTDQLIDAAMARALHADACRNHAAVAWVVLHLKGTQEGMTLSLGREEILIEML